MDINVIIEEFKNNNHSNFKKFYDMTCKQIYFSAITILKDQASAEDVLQETYISFLNSINTFKHGANVYAYLSTIARNMSINIYNKQKRLILSDQIIEFEHITYDKYLTSSYKEILDLLDSEEEKEIVTYHVILEYKFKDISKIMSKPLGTVLWIYNKSIKKLKERMVSNHEE